MVSVLFSPDGRYLLSASQYKQIKLWQVGKGGMYRTVQVLDEPCSYLSSIVFSPNDRWLAFGGINQEIHLWKRDHASESHFRPAQKLQTGFTIFTLAFSPNGQLLAVDNWNEIALWRFDEGKQQLQQVQSLKASLGGWAQSLAFSPFGGRLASASHDKLVLLEQGKDGDFRQIREFKMPDDCIPRVAFSPNGKWYALGAGDRVFFWKGDIPDRRPLARKIADRLKGRIAMNRLTDM